MAYMNTGRMYGQMAEVLGFSAIDRWVELVPVPWCSVHDAQALPWDSNPDVFDECWQAIWTSAQEACRIEKGVWRETPHSSNHRTTA